MHDVMHESSMWSVAPPAPSLLSGEVHVWRAALDQPVDLLQRLRTTLAAEEIERANRFYFDRHRNHFLAGRGFLRSVLARYLQVPAESLEFAYGPFGKPVLNDTRLRFNMSHSNEVALLAITEDRELGVDVEHIRVNFATEEIARRFFSPVEVETFNRLAKHEQVAAFFRCWTRKEAYIKAIGRGLSQPLDGFDVTLAPGERAALLRADEDDATRWTMHDLEVGADYAAALAVAGPISTLRTWQGVL